MVRTRWIVAALVVLLLISSYFALATHKTNRALSVQLEREHETQLIVNQFMALPQVALPSRLSPYWTVRGTEKFEDAPIQIVEFGDPLCSDCQILFRQMAKLKQEFPGKINVAFQFFPLEAKCNSVVAKNKHPGACDLSYMLASAPDRFVQMHDDIFENLLKAKTPEWRADFARRYGVTAALGDSVVHTTVRTFIATGAEYARTSPKYPHGIRSTPTLIINGRMIIGTLTLPQMRAIFKALIDMRAKPAGEFLENWIKTGCAVDEDAAAAACQDVS